MRIRKSGVNALVEISGRAFRDIADERLRQISQEGFLWAHDDGHTGGELARAGAAYAYAAALPDQLRIEVTGNRSLENDGTLRDLWPRGWHGWWKPKDRRRDLVRAAALILAEIERLDRREAGS